MIDLIAFLSPAAAAVMARPIEDCGLPPSIATMLADRGVHCAARLLGLTTRQLLAWHTQGIVTESQLDEIDEAICRLSCDLAAATDRSDA